MRGCAGRPGADGGGEGAKQGNIHKLFMDYSRFFEIFAGEMCYLLDAVRFQCFPPDPLTAVCRGAALSRRALRGAWILGSGRRAAFTRYQRSKNAWIRTPDPGAEERLTAVPWERPGSADQKQPLCRFKIFAAAPGPQPLRRGGSAAFSTVKAVRDMPVRLSGAQGGLPAGPGRPGRAVFPAEDPFAG